MHRDSIVEASAPVSIRRITDPTVDVVTLPEQKEWSRLKGTAQDAKLTAMIASATEYFEKWTRRSLLQQTWQITYDSLPFTLFRIPQVPRIIQLPYARIISLDKVEVFFENDTSEEIQTRFRLDSFSEPGRIILKNGQAWPSGLREIDAVHIEYKAGYGTSPDDVPLGVKSAIMYLAADLLENSESWVVGTIVAQVPRGAEALMIPYRIWTL